MDKDSNRQQYVKGQKDVGVIRQKTYRRQYLRGV